MLLRDTPVAVDVAQSDCLPEQKPAFPHRPGCPAVRLGPLEHHLLDKAAAIVLPENAAMKSQRSG
jgi:hypothetical protein